MKRFALIGLSGFVAKKHVKCISQLNGDLVAALDTHDNVGFVDSFFPNCFFFKNEKSFFSYIKKNDINYVVICSPSFLHFKHISLSLKSGCNVIVEKPPILNSSDFKKVEVLQKKFKKTCHCIFQLREDKRLIYLKKTINKLSAPNKVKIDYHTRRGKWYETSWKSNKKFSGGLLINIGIHFVDILIWLFGDIEKITIIKNTKEQIIGKFKMTNADVDWKLSITNYKNLNFFREMRINDYKINFDIFNDLHLENYKSIINKKKFAIKNFKKLLKNIEKLKF